MHDEIRAGNFTNRLSSSMQCFCWSFDLTLHPRSLARTKLRYEADLYAASSTYKSSASSVPDSGIGMDADSLQMNPFVIGDKAC